MIKTWKHKFTELKRANLGGGKLLFLILKCSSIAASLYRQANYDGITSAMWLPAKLSVGMYIDQVDDCPLKRAAIFTLDVMYETSYKTI